MQMESSLKQAMTTIDGAVGIALVDYTSGMALATLGDDKALDLSVAAAGNTDVVRAKLHTMEILGIQSAIEDILITLNDQYHLIRLLTSKTGEGLFLYLVLDRHHSNLAMARHRLSRIEAEIEIS
ncbi:hypothetical protein GCM10010245_92010 [Streptomyces spectabilis]|nr:hypothetical protein GCM10010245_92010 [Streptomyces spectabilis]